MILVAEAWGQPHYVAERKRRGLQVCAKRERERSTGNHLTFITTHSWGTSPFLRDQELPPAHNDVPMIQTLPTEPAPKGSITPLHHYTADQSRIQTIANPKHRGESRLKSFISELQMLVKAGGLDGLTWA